MWLAMVTDSGSILHVREEDIRQIEGHAEAGFYAICLAGREDAIRISKESYEGLIRHIRKED